MDTISPIHPNPENARKSAQFLQLPGTNIHLFAHMQLFIAIEGVKRADQALEASDPQVLQHVEAPERSPTRLPVHEQQFIPDSPFSKLKQRILQMKSPKRGNIEPQLQSPVSSPTRRWSSPAKAPNSSTIDSGFSTPVRQKAQVCGHSC